jgi:CBS domain-containing protein
MLPKPEEMNGHARNLMTTPVISVTRDIPLSEIARILSSERIGGVPVIDREQHVVGMVSELDIMGALLAGRSLDTLAAEVMTHPVFTVDEFDLTDEVMRLFRQHRIHRLPVVREKKLVGIITPSDVIRFLSEQLPGAPKAG